MSKEIELRFPADVRYLHLATNLARQICTLVLDRRGNDDLFYDIPLCISEACTNAIQYGGDEPGRRVTLMFSLQKDRLVFRVGDQGRGFDLNAVPVPNFDEHPERGYGIYIIRAKMDGLEYIPGEQENVLIMTKLIGSSERGEREK